MNDQAIITRIKNAGKGIEVIGLFLLIYNVAFIFVLGKIFLPALVITAVLGLVFLILGWRIRKNPGPASKAVLWVTAAISLILLVVSFSNFNTKGVALYLIVAVFVSSLVGLDGIRKLGNPALQTAEVQGQNLKGKDKAKDLLKMIVIAIVVIGGLIGMGYVGHLMGN